MKPIWRTVISSAVFTNLEPVHRLELVCGHVAFSPTRLGLPTKLKCKDCVTLRAGGTLEVNHLDGTWSMETWDHETQMPKRTPIPEPMEPTLTETQLIEQHIISQLVLQLAGAGWELDYFDSRTYKTHVSGPYSAWAALNECSDYGYLRFKNESEQPGARPWVKLIAGGGKDVIHDFSDSGQEFADIVSSIGLE
jgi:hypothetical protein